MAPESIFDGVELAVASDCDLEQNDYPVSEVGAGLYTVCKRWSGRVQYQVGDPEDEENFLDVDLEIRGEVFESSETDEFDREQGVIEWFIRADLGPFPRAEDGLLAFGCSEEGEVSDGTEVCCGFVTFTVETRMAEEDEDDLENTALIVFDSELGGTPPIVTDPSAVVTIVDAAPLEPEFPDPVNGAENVDPNEAKLNWQSTFGQCFDVYYWPDGEERPSTPTGQDLGENVFTIPDEMRPLQGNTTYLWQVEASNSEGTTLGPTWALSTHGQPFRRGDVDGNGRLQITDPILSLQYQFRGGVEVDCLEALDVDDSGDLQITDPILNLEFQFKGGDVIPPPNDCGGGDDTPDMDGNHLGCIRYESCP